MAQDNDEKFLSRWSRRKREDRAQVQEEKKPAVAEGKKEDLPPPLPAVESLTPQSDFSGFMHPKVADSLRRVALKKLFADPHFNVPDLNEAYSGDWTVGEPISEEFLKTLNQAKTHLFKEDEKKVEEIVEEQLKEKPEKPQQEAREPDEPGRQDT
jgi:hypothetical protein